MNNDTSKHLIPSLIEEVLSHPGRCVDNVFASAWKGLKMNRLIHRAGFKKRTGLSVTEAVFLLVLWKWVDAASIAVFSRKSLKTYSDANKDVMYDLMKREDTDWRGLNISVAKSTYQQQHIALSRIKAYVLDDTVAQRRGRKMEGVSCHFDHTEGRHVMGQQVLTLGLVTEDLFMPIDSQIYVSQSKAHDLIRGFKDKRSIVAKRYDEATTQSKPEIAKGMLGRAKRHGLKADYLVADAWFGTKPMIQTAQSLGVTAILRMKKGNMKYRIAGANGDFNTLDAKELYQQAVKGEWKKVRGLPYRAVQLEVDLDISAEGTKPPKWLTIKLLFVRGIAAEEKASVGKKDWALFLTTDPSMSLSKVLEIYALRWAIEVYFKEAKQHLGFLKEQTWTFASHTASIHLSAIRYLTLLHAKRGDDERRVCDIRAQIKDQLTTLDFAQRLWQLFRALVSGTIDSYKKALGRTAEIIMEAIDGRIEEFFSQALQLDVFTLKMEFRS